MGRPTRRRRKFTRRKAKGKGKGKSKAFLCRLCSSHYDAVEAEDFKTYIATRRKGSGKGKSRKNPIGPDGQIMKCHICGSDTHLKNKCDRNRGGGGQMVLIMPTTTVTRSEKFSRMVTRWSCQRARCRLKLPTAISWIMFSLQILHRMLSLNTDQNVNANVWQEDVHTDQERDAADNAEIVNGWLALVVAG